MMSLDGYFEGPAGEIDWHNVDADFNDFAVSQLNNASALVFGRKTYELMAGYWPSDAALRDDPVVAWLMNSVQKIVFSKTLDGAGWNNTRLIRGNVAETCTRLKESSTKDIFIFGSAELASALINAGLIDEFRVIINPVILGCGNPLFKPLPERLKLKLISTTAFASGNILCIYRPFKA